MVDVNLSFDADKDAQPIALVMGGDMHKQKLFLHSSDKKVSKPKRELDIGNAHLKKLPARKQSDIIRMLSEAYKKGVAPEHLMVDDVGVRSMYEDMIRDAENDKEQTIKLPPNSSFVILPTANPSKREIFYIAGASGSGKSYIAKGIAEQYQKKFPDRTVFLISKLSEDETLDSMKQKPIRLKIDKLIENPLKELEPLQNSMVIFDDYDSFTGKEAKVIEELMNDIATMGRHHCISMLCLTHYLSNYRKTRLLLTEATHFVLYPQSTGAMPLSYLLKTHLGMDKKEIEKLRKNGSRWICIQKNFPQYCITENSAWVLNQS